MKAKSLDIVKFFENAIVFVYTALWVLWASFSQLNPTAAYDFVMASNVIEFLPRIFSDVLLSNFNALAEAEGVSVAQSFFAVQAFFILCFGMFGLPLFVMTCFSGVSNFTSFKSDLLSLGKTPLHDIILWFFILTFSAFVLAWAFFSPDYFLTWRNDYSMFHRPGFHSLLLLGLMGGAGRHQR